jgi:ACR3 family arsenite efflux pump ArsB
MGNFERYLSLWVGLCIAGGVILGVAFPGAFKLISKLEYANYHAGCQLVNQAIYHGGIGGAVF